MMSGMGMGMEGMMGDMMVTPTPLQAAIDSLKQAQTEPQRKQSLADVRSKLAAQYDSFLSSNEAQLKEMEQRLENLRVQLKRRVDAKDLLVDLELKRISNEAQGLTWPGGQGNQNRGMGSIFGEGMKGQSQVSSNFGYFTGRPNGRVNVTPTRTNSDNAQRGALAELERERSYREVVASQPKATARVHDSSLERLMSAQAKMPTPDVLKDPPVRTRDYGKTRQTK